MPTLGQVFVYLVAILVQLPVYLLVKIHMANDITHVTVHPWYQWAKFLFWYIIYHDIILLISYAYTTEANLISCFMVWIFGHVGINLNGLFGSKSSCKKKRRKNRRKRRKPHQGFYSEYDEFDQEDDEDQYHQQSQEAQDDTCEDDTNGDQTKCDQLLKNLLALVPGMMAGQASHYEKLVEQFKGASSQ